MACVWMPSEYEQGNISQEEMITGKEKKKRDTERLEEGQKKRVRGDREGKSEVTDSERLKERYRARFSNSLKTRVQVQPHMTRARLQGSTVAFWCAHSGNIYYHHENLVSHLSLLLYLHQLLSPSFCIVSIHVMPSG